ncbi:MAG: hypothetical protein M3334_07565 [Actinomycetota bacterium]|nr:hypothetical protein [Actinomycetota bacterium]
MRYLVTLSYIDPGPLLAAQQVSGLIKGESSPTLEALAGLESEGKIRGGITAGARGGAFALAADRSLLAEALRSSVGKKEAGRAEGDSARLLFSGEHSILA